MTHQIVYTEVAAVLLDDGWHTVKAGSLEMTQIEFGILVQGRFEARFGPNNTGMAPGITFLDQKGDRYSASMRSIRAIRENAPKPTLLPAEEPGEA